jgi:arginine repressor
MTKNIEKKSFTKCLTNFMSDHKGLSQEDLIEELEEQRIDVKQLKTDIKTIINNNPAKPERAGK